jgi:hypothetical protein
MSLYHPRVRWLLTFSLAISLAAFALFHYYLIITTLTHGDIWFNDFFGIWSFAKFSVVQSVSTIYDNSILSEFQMDLGAHPKHWSPYAHPPSFLFLILPLGLLSFYLAYGVWHIFTFFIISFRISL